MEFRFNKTPILFYSLMLFLTSGLLLSGGIYFWKDGAINYNNVSAIFEANTLVDKLKDKKVIKEIKKTVEFDKVRESVKLADQFQEPINQLHNIVSFQTEYKKMNQSFLESRNSLNKLLSYPEISVLLKILNNKVSDFNSFVNKNSWRTLTRTSSVLSAQLENLRIGKEELDLAKLNSLYFKISQGISYMEKVTNSSVLSHDDKNIIITKLKTFDQELEMFKELLSQLKEFYNSISKFEADFDIWFLKISPALALKKMGHDDQMKMMIFYFLGVLLLSFLAIPVGYMITKKNGNKGKNFNNQETLEVISQGILSKKMELFEKRFGKQYPEFIKLKDYIHRRMNFGTYFQETLPFATLLLDSNLGLVWANKQFYTDWCLEDLKTKDTITWDYLQRFTNLGENDPIMEALNNKISGIYQIQVRPEAGSETIPYEMYVAPIGEDNDVKIMIFLYPLKSMEETISDLTRSIIGPVSRTLDALIKEDYGQGFKEKTKKDFEIAEITGLYFLFEKYFEHNKSIKNELVKEINKLENRIYDYIKGFSEVSKINNEKLDFFKVNSKNFEKLKSELISTIDLRQKMEQLCLGTISTAKEQLKDENELIKNSQKLIEITNSNLEVFEKISNFRKDFKDFKNYFEDLRGKLGQNIEVAMRSDKNTINESIVSNINLKIKAVEKEVVDFNKNLSVFDLFVSKMEMLYKDLSLPEMSHFAENLNNARENIETDMFNVSKITKEGINNDDHLVKTLKEFFDGHHWQYSKVQTVSKVIDHYLVNEIYPEADSTPVSL